jgi:hyperosmotically inducible periplasmic protein
MPFQEMCSRKSWLTDRRLAEEAIPRNQANSARVGSFYPIEGDLRRFCVPVYSRKGMVSRKAPTLNLSLCVPYALGTFALKGDCAMTTKFFKKTGLSLASLIWLAVPPAFASAATQQPDNTSANKNTQGAPTADQQKETPADRDLAKKIRQSIVSDKSLSTYAHNVKVIVRDGNVALRGPVKSEDEKAAVESKATALAGTGKVENDLTVKASSNQ